MTTSAIQSSAPIVTVEMPASAGATAAPPEAEANASLLPAPDDRFASLDAGDVGAALAKLVLESAHSQRKEARAARQASERAQREAEAKQLEELRSRNDAAFSAGVIGGFATMASGALTVASAGPSGHAASVSSTATAAEVLSAGSAKTNAMIFEGAARGLEGSGKLFGAFAQSRADEHGTDATQAEQTAGREGRAVDDAKGDAEAAEKSLDRAIAFYREWVTAKADVQKAAFLRA